MKKYYLQDEYDNHQNECTCIQKYGKCKCEKPQKRKSFKRKNAGKSMQKQNSMLFVTQQSFAGGCGSCGTNAYDQRGSHSTPPPVFQPISQRPTFEQQTSPMPPRKRDLPYYKEDVPTKEHAYVADQPRPMKTVRYTQGVSPVRTQEFEPVPHKETLNGQFPFAYVEGKRLSEEMPMPIGSFCDKTQQGGHPLQPHQSQQQPHKPQQDRHLLQSSRQLPPRHREHHFPENQEHHFPQPYQQQQLHQPACHTQRDYYYQLRPRQESQYLQQYYGHDLYRQPQNYPQQAIEVVHENCCGGAMEVMYSASRFPEVRQKKWSFMKSINNAFRAMKCKDKKPPGICECGANLNICGPYNKPCNGLEGVIMPCGFECECGPNKACLRPYMKDLCPCVRTCQCPRDYLMAPQSEYELLNTQYSQHTIPLPAGLPVSAPISLPAGPAVCPPVDNSLGDERCGCTKYAQQAASKGRIAALEVHGQNCCCTCDEEMCPCCCCCCLDTSQKRVQTSRFFLRENFAQTEKAGRKCCRCCRCCSSKGKKTCAMCMKDPDDNLYGDRYNGRSDDALHKRSNYSMQDLLHFRPQTHPAPSASHTQYIQAGGGNRPRMNTETPRGTVKIKRKTTIVKTNSAQCLPSQENKSTSCTYGDTINSETRLDQFLSQLCAANDEANKQLRPINTEAVDLTGDRKRTAITLDAGDINKLTRAKLRHYFLEGDVYSSPVSGRHYDLSYKTVSAPSKLTDTKLLKPLDVNDELQFSNLPAHCFASDAEHAKLMTAVCDAILSSNREGIDIAEEPTKETKVADVRGSAELAQQKIDILQTIREDAESLSDAKDKSADVDGVEGASDQDESKNVIFEMQKNFKDKIEKLESKIDRLMVGNSSDAAEQIKARCKTEERSRSRSTSPRSQQKKIMEHKPLVTRTGLFGVIPTRTQLFVRDPSTGRERISAIAHQKGDARPEEDRKAVDESVSRYEDLVSTNQKRVDELLVQLEALHGSSALLDKSAALEIVPPAICCFEATEESTYRPNLGTGENFVRESFPMSSESLFGHLDDLLTENANGNRNNDNLSHLGSSTSSARETGIIDDDTDRVRCQQPLDFSSIVFKRYVADGTGRDLGENRGDVSPMAARSDPNFIVRNLPSITTNISDTFAVQRLIRKEVKTASKAADSRSSKTDSFDDFLVKASNSSVYS